MTSSGSGRRSLVFLKSCEKTSRICSRRKIASPLFLSSALVSTEKWAELMRNHFGGAGGLDDALDKPHAQNKSAGRKLRGWKMLRGMLLAARTKKPDAKRCYHGLIGNCHFGRSGDWACRRSWSRLVIIRPRK